jgi:pyruvate-ferredoxin/flavodoxin oxidoreductase
MNLRSVDMALEHMFEVRIPATATSVERTPSARGRGRSRLCAGRDRHHDPKPRGPVCPSAPCPIDGTFPVGTAAFEKRNLAQEIPVWDTGTCIQCNKCVMICPHSVIRSKVVEPALLANAPATFKSRDAIERDWKGQKFLLQVAPEDCTGCNLCVEICPARNKSEAKLKAINMRPQPPLRATEKENWDFFLGPARIRSAKTEDGADQPGSNSNPLFEFSGACSGCGETPYLETVCPKSGATGR